MWFNVISTFNSGGHFIQLSGTILAILVKDHDKNISVKLFQNQATGHGDVIKGFSIFNSGSHFAQRSRTILAILVKSQKRNISVKLF